MTFGEKLFQLRKEKGLSQEALAEKLNTSRQAISKWENGQGYPETDKILKISQVFEVSTDYLLKESTQPSVDKQAGYYVSEEMAEGYLLSAHKTSKYVGLGLFLIALAIIPYFLFDQDPAKYLLPTIILATLGIGMFVSVSFMEEERYKVLKQESLLFDDKHLKALSLRYENLKKKYAILTIVGVGLFVAGLVTLGIDRRFIESDFLAPYYPICIGLIAIGVYILARTSTVLSAYKLLANNEDYTSKFGFLIKRKLKDKMTD